MRIKLKSFSYPTCSLANFISYFLPFIFIQLLLGHIKHIIIQDLGSLCLSACCTLPPDTHITSVWSPLGPPPEKPSNHYLLKQVSLSLYALFFFIALLIPVKIFYTLFAFLCMCLLHWKISLKQAFHFVCHYVSQTNTHSRHSCTIYMYEWMNN